jgi:hypothetical protein
MPYQIRWTMLIFRHYVVTFSPYMQKLCLFTFLRMWNVTSSKSKLFWGRRWICHWKTDFHCRIFSVHDPLHQLKCAQSQPSFYIILRTSWMHSTYCTVGAHTLITNFLSLGDFLVAVYLFVCWCFLINVFEVTSYMGVTMHCLLLCQQHYYYKLIRNRSNHLSVLCAYACVKQMAFTVQRGIEVLQ